MLMLLRDIPNSMQILQVASNNVIDFRRSPIEGYDYNQTSKGLALY